MKKSVAYIVWSSLFILLLTGCSRKSSGVRAGDGNPSVYKEFPEGKFWKDADSGPTSLNCPGKVLPLSYRLLQTDTLNIRKKLVIQGARPGVVATDTLVVDIPLPDGTWETFRMNQVQVMAPELAAKYPYLKTYAGYSTLYPADQIRLEVNPGGVRAMILSTRGTILLDPFCDNDKVLMISFYKKNLPEGTKEDFERK